MEMPPTLIYLHGKYVVKSGLKTLGKLQAPKKEIKESMYLLFAQSHERTHARLSCMWKPSSFVYFWSVVAKAKGFRRKKGQWSDSLEWRHLVWKKSFFSNDDMLCEFRLGVIQIIRDTFGGGGGLAKCHKGFFYFWNAAVNAFGCK
jgi:hypothetical protein